ncbi:tRNA epoxyqueuosine(34) reductase QueG [Beggiatoa leptomitoformis]|uniref:Epoxyqueuosine reductase n=1 Tax=Beggiatoa leptomitoformis TaxID=288004 RepID=A0A2N9YEX4_9GAMM|nr:tRNA epoxyqueuosine(34) reductase QueG [Beggiatoa leptomitoformis]ALG68613.1 tRNA epoxyqueuosine(34) reductase QueG [Beggiatoa leptomitoformis]AUI69041.1 tRNA epoxyqueuosine(34) reductase QueG [Beggiatoa leptomitoformis]
MLDYNVFASNIKQWGIELGFQQVGISDIDLTTAEQTLIQWLNDGYHGDMAFMAKHGTKRSRPAELVPDTLRVISVRMDYLPESQMQMLAVLNQSGSAYISRYALGRDYHKVLRQRLKQLAIRITKEIDGQIYRVFVDSAPVLEKPLAEKAGLGWIGKHTNLINRQVGSYFFLGEIYVDLPLPVDVPVNAHCGRCQACLTICPTQAIIAPYQLDARRCIAYLTIEFKGSIPIELRPLIGNRIYGCDDCQLVCPWNRFAQLTTESDFLPRQALINPPLITLFNWTEAEFLQQTEGSAIRRIGYESWLRNIAVALGNATPTTDIIACLQQRLSVPSTIVREHVEWALQRLQR